MQGARRREAHSGPQGDTKGGQERQGRGLAQGRAQDTGGAIVLNSIFIFRKNSRYRRRALFTHVPKESLRSHPNVVRMISAFETDQELAAVTEFVAGGDLVRITQEAREFPTKP